MIMAIVERNRILRPSTRLASSISYKINTEKVSGLDELIVRVYSEQKRLIAEFHFAGRDIAGKRSIHFRYINERIDWGKYENLISKKHKFNSCNLRHYFNDHLKLANQRTANSKSSFGFVYVEVRLSLPVTFRL